MAQIPPIYTVILSVPTLQKNTIQNNSTISKMRFDVICIISSPKSPQCTINHLFLFFVNRWVTTLNALSATYDDKNAMDNSTSAHMAGTILDLLFNIKFSSSFVSNSMNSSYSDNSAPCWFEGKSRTESGIAILRKS